LSDSKLIRPHAPVRTPAPIRVQVRRDPDSRGARALPARDGAAWGVGPVPQACCGDREHLRALRAVPRGRGVARGGRAVAERELQEPNALRSADGAVPLEGAGVDLIIFA